MRGTIIPVGIAMAVVLLGAFLPLGAAMPSKYDPLPDLPGFFSSPRDGGTQEQQFWHYKGNPKNNDAHCDAWILDDDPNKPNLEGPAC